MIKPIRIILQEEPTPKARSRVAFIHGKAHSYTPARTEEAQNLIKVRLMRYRDRMCPKNIPVKLTVVFYRTKSKYLPRKEALPFRRPDLDNLEKLVNDSMIGILLEDDAQITTVHARKRWSDKPEGYITIRLEEDS